MCVVTRCQHACAFSLSPSPPSLFLPSSQLPHPLSGSSPPPMILHPHQPRGLEVSIQETLIKQISLSLRQAALCLCKGTGSFPLGVWWALRRGGAADFSRFSDWKMTDSKEVYPSWVISSWHPWTSSGFRLSPLGGSTEARQRLGHSIPGKGGSKLAVWGSCPSPQTALLRACDSGFLDRESRYLVSPFSSLQMLLWAPHWSWFPINFYEAAATQRSV